MRLVLDGRTLLSKNPRGTGKAFAEVYRRLAAKHPDWEILVVHRNDRAASNPFGGISNVTTQELDLPGQYRFNLWQSLGLPWAARTSDANLIHCPANTGPRWSSRPVLVTIHDLIPLQPEFCGNAPKQWAKRVARIARHARYVTTPSEFSRRQIVETFGLPDEKVISIPWAGNSCYGAAGEAGQMSRVRSKYGIAKGQPYVLVFGAEDPRKNTSRILQAWGRLSHSERKDAVLLVIGLQQPFRDALLQNIVKDRTAGSVRLHGYVPEEDVPLLLGGCEFLCFPTLYEGFGLPVLDAFVCESAVLTSRNSSIPEVAGEAAVYVDPRCSTSISAGMAELLGDEQARRQLVDAGREQAKRFSWDRCAEQYGEVIQRFA